MKLAEAVGSWKVWWTEAGPLTRALIVTGGVIVLIGIMFLFADDGESDLAPLYTQLDSSDASTIIESLRERKVEYTLDKGGSTILVPREQIYELRLDLAAAGLPRGGGVGFEIFDKNSLMMTDFTQRVNYTRALQGELARTIGQLPQVESARVHLALPENSLFTRDRIQPSASVYLKLRPGRTLTPKQAAGITHLVSTAIEGLSADRVAVLDGDGRLLGNAPDDDSTGASSRTLAMVHEYEGRMEQRLIDLLSSVVGRNRVVARVTADMDFGQVEATEEKYDAEGATVLSERRSTESAQSQTRDLGGVAGTTGNLPQTATPPGEVGTGRTGSDSNRNLTQTDYAVPRTVKRIRRPMNSVTRLSVAVLIDSSPTDDIATATTPRATGVEIPTPGTEPDTAAVSELIKKAVGFDVARGDQIEVAFVPFSKAEPIAAAATSSDEVIAQLANLRWKSVVLTAMIPLVIFAAGFIIARRRIRADLAAVMQRRRELEEEAAKTGEVIEEEAKADEARLREEVRRFAQENAETTRHMIKHWLNLAQQQVTGNSPKGAA